jgi:hypothetical protein
MLFRHDLFISHSDAVRNTFYLLPLKQDLFYTGTQERNYRHTKDY